MRKGTLVVAIVVIGMLIASGAYYLAEVLVTYDAVGHSEIHAGYMGNSLEEDAAYDLLDATKYVTGWDKTDYSEKIVVRGQVIDTGGPLISLWEAYNYKLIFNTEVDIYYNGYTTNDVTTWTSPSFGSDAGIDIGKGRWNSLQSIIVYIIGPFNGKIHAELWGAYTWYDAFSFDPFKTGYDRFCVDEAGLVSGTANVIAPTVPVEEGQTAKFTVTTGVSHSEISTGGGWTFEIHEPKDRGGDVVYSKTIADNKVTEVSWLVPEGSYSSTGDNAFYVRLINQLFDVSHDYMFIIGIGMTAQIPYSPTILALDGDPPYEAGTTPRFQLEVEKNPDGYDVIGFQVFVQLSDASGGSGPYLLQAVFYTANYDATTKLYWTTFQFTVEQSGWYKIQASTVDAMHLNSPMSSLVVSTAGPGGGDETPTYDWLSLVLGVVAVAFGIILGILLMMYIPPPYGVIIGVAMMLILIVIGGYFLMGFISDATDKGLMLFGGMR